ncbi:hypothetical protein H5410_004894 [Solanum commersonii]|uniref:Uncharacterized protein n=1 Tax=Solanum commersonii TaxID=4109 RepID=A0A9J6A642_SOLCO|nr:hypothetical protein H5410_004894 [Solanum commersonii]
MKGDQILPKGEGKRYTYERVFAESQAALRDLEDDQPLQSRWAEIHARSQSDSARVPLVSTTADTVPAPAPLVAPVPQVVPPPRLLNRLKGDGLSTILEEKLLSIKGLEGKYSGVKDTLHFHRFE